MKYLFLLGCSFFLADPTLAQDAAVEDDAAGTITLVEPLADALVTVVASGSEVGVQSVGQSVTVMSGAEIDSVQGPDLTRALERLPGVTITRNGGLGNFTGLRVRGADAEQLLVLVDGVRMADTASPAGGYDLGNLLSGGVSKVELLRGSNSVVWGSQAMGGVLAVTTGDLDGGRLAAEYGAQNSVSANASYGKYTSGLQTALTAGYVRTDGISTAAMGTEPDGFRQWRVTGRVKAELSQDLYATFAARYADSRLDIDGFPAPSFSFADTPEYQITREASGRAGLEYRTGGVQLRGSYALTDIRRAYFDPTFGTAPNYETFGRSERAELNGTADLPANFTLDFGADNERTRFRSSFDPEHKARQSSGHALLGFRAYPVSLAAGVRVDDHSKFGTHWTFGANGSYDVGGGWRLRASYGEGFKAPTLFQLLSDYGNGALRPETSRSVDAGIELGERNGRGVHLAATLFRRDSKDLIDFVSCFGVTTGICTSRPFGTYNNVSRARAEGFELEGDVQPVDGLSIHAAYSYVKTVNRGNSKDLARRPRHALSLSADWETPLAGIKLGADLRVVSRSFDDAGNFTQLDGYALGTLRASVPLGERFELYGRIENVGNVRYQTAAGYGTAGRSAYIGARARF